MWQNSEIRNTICNRFKLLEADEHEKEGMKYE